MIWVMTVDSRTAPATAAPPTSMGGRAKLVLFVLCAAQFAVALDFSILNVALPVLGHDLGLGEADLQWAVTAFALPSGGFLLLFGRIADLYGRRRLFLTGLALFTLASVLAALAWGPVPFLAARALQGLGAAIIVPTGLSLLTTSFPEGPQRDRALGISGTLLSLGFTVGMVFGGVLTSALGWRSTMALNVIMGALVLVAAPLLLTEHRPTDRPRLDVPGAVTVTGGLLALIYSLSTAAQRGWGHPDVLGTLVAAVALLAAFVLIESRATAPLVSLRVLRRRSVAWGNLGGLTTFAMMSSVIFLSTLYLQQVRGLSPLASGLLFGVMGLGAAVAGTVAPRLVGRFGPRTVLVSGLTLQAACTALLLATGPHGAVPVVLLTAAGTVACMGHLGAIVSYGITATSGLANHEQGLATGLVTTAQQVGLTLGIPILSALAAAHTTGLRHAGTPSTPAMLSGIHLGLAADAALVLAVALLIALFLRARPVKID
jgi:EmrB/QacA subfamily drug resistance transporter